MPTDIDVMIDAALRRDIERRLAAKGLKVLDIEVFRIGPRTDIESMLPAMEFVRKLGAKYMLCASLLATEHHASDEPRTVEKFAELCETGARMAIKPMLEFMSYRSVRTIEDALRMVRFVRHPNMGICVNALHSVARAEARQRCARLILVCCATRKYAMPPLRPRPLPKFPSKRAAIDWIRGTGNFR